MGFFDDAVPGGDISKPVMLAVGALLLGKMMNRPDAGTASAAPPDYQGAGQGAVQGGGQGSGQGSGQGGGQGMGGLIGGLLSGGGIGSLLSGAGGAGAGGGGVGGAGGGTGGGGLLGSLSGGLGGLLQQLNASGHGQTANSWVGNGANQPIQPSQLNAALGSTTVSQLAQHAGLSEQDLLNELSRVLPGVVDKLTPNGQVPDTQQVASVWNRHQGG